MHTRKKFRNFGTYLIQLHYIFVSFYDFSFYDHVLLEPNPVVKRVLPVQTSVSICYDRKRSRPDTACEVCRVGRCDIFCYG